MPLTANQLHYPNILACFALGIPANIALLWLIRHRTSTELRPYSRILAQTAILDTASLVINLLCQPIYLSRGTDYASYGVGLALCAPGISMACRWWNLLLSLTWVFCSALSIYSLSVQFYYRYTVMCRWASQLFHPYTSNTTSSRDRRLSLRTYFLLLLIPVGAALTLCSATARGAGLSDEDLARARAAFTPEDGPYVISYNDPFWYTVSNSLTLLYTIGAYAVVVCCSVRTWLHMRRMIALTGEAAATRLRDANRQVTTVLLFQTLSPLVFGIALACYVAAVNLKSGGNDASILTQSLLAVPLNWMSAANGLFALMVIRSYRRVVLQALRRACCLASKFEMDAAMQVAPVATVTDLTIDRPRITTL